MVVRVPGWPYQRGFGGHFHNDNSWLHSTSPGSSSRCPPVRRRPRLLRTLVGMAAAEDASGVRRADRAVSLPGPARARRQRAGTVSAAAGVGADAAVRDEGRLHVLGESAAETLVVTFGNGVGMSRRGIAACGVRADVYDLRWLAPLPAEHLLVIARGYGSVLVVDETRRSGGVSERVVRRWSTGLWRVVRRVTSADSVIPLGPAAATVLLSEAQVAAAARPQTPPPLPPPAPPTTALTPDSDPNCHPAPAQLIHGDTEDRYDPLRVLIVKSVSRVCGRA